MSIIQEQVWNKDSIIKHQENMISWFMETFSIPEYYRKRYNWNTKEIEQNNFSPLDDDAGDFAEGNKPLELRIENEVIKVSTWQDVFIKFLKYIKKDSKYDFQFIIDNQTDLFKNENTIIKWPVLENIVDNDSDKSNRYKTFDGKTWDKVDNLTESEMFIHINISASTCMARIANIMNKFNMTHDSVDIVLK